VIPLLPAGEKMFHDVEHTAFMEVPCSNATAVRNGGPVSLFDLLHTLQKNRKPIPSHSVYSVNVERLLRRLNHPGRDE
jgi:transcriptional adapter 1